MPIFYEPALAAQGFPRPLVRARIADHEALFLIDTGASVNTLASWFAEAAKIPTETTTSTAQGSTGKDNPVRAAYGVRGMWSDGGAFVLREAIVVAFPSIFESYLIRPVQPPTRQPFRGSPFAVCLVA